MVSEIPTNSILRTDGACNQFTVSPNPAASEEFHFLLNQEPKTA